MADETNDELGFAEAMDFLADRISEEEEQLDGDVPNHATTLVVSEATELLKTATSIDMAYEMADEEGPDEEAMEEALLDGVVDLLTAVGALKYEEGIDITGALEERISFIEDYRQFEEAMKEAEDRDEQMEAMDEYFTDELAEELGMGQVPEGGMGVGANMDNEDYDHEQEDVNFH